MDEKEKKTIDGYEIKPCPFCGSLNIQIDKCVSRVRCRNCFATSGMISRLIAYAGVDEKVAPILAWNTRYYDGSKND